MSDTESYVNKAELKRKVRAWLKYNQSSKQATNELLGLIEKLSVTVKGQLETTLESEWISVKDRLPDKDGKYMVWYKGEWDACEFDVCEFDVDSKTFGFTYDDYDEMNSPLVCWDDDMDKYVTHWRPLPEPPESEDAE